MKNIFKIFTFLFIPFLIVGCSDDEIAPIIEASDLRLVDPGITTLTLNLNTPDVNALVLSWDDFSGYTGQYSVQIAKDASFENWIELGTTSNNNFALNMAHFNAIINQLDITPYLASTVYIRVNNGALTSNSIFFNVKSYPLSGPVITTPQGGLEIAINSETPNDQAIQISWDDYGYGSTDANVTYIVQMALAGTNFANPVVLSNTSNTSITISHADLNNYAMAAGIGELSTAEVEIRVLSMINATTGETLQFVSVSVSVSITTAEGGIQYFYLVGEAVAAGWNPNNNNQPLFNDAANPATAYFTGRFLPGGFKVIEELGNWQPQWGSNDGSTLALNDGSGNDPDVFSTPSEGYYTFTFNSQGSGGTFSLTPFDASGAATYSTIGIIGDATADGWNSDQDMTQSDFDPHIWYAHNVNLSGGEIKFRAENGWDINWGANTPLFGQGTPGGPNIPVDAGVYHIWFNDLDGRYILIAQ
ncbi:MAG: SusE domain-containing protein [Flavobacteriaceae bacterium]|nr:SusE domain-containing protein [Flavobacteriaceae bacterium]